MSSFFQAANYLVPKYIFEYIIFIWQKIYITLPSIIDHQTIQLRLRAMYNTYSYMWGPCIITSILKVPLATSLHFTQSWFTSCSSWALAVEPRSTKVRQRSRVVTIPIVCSAKSIFTTWKQSRFWKYLHLRACQLCVHYVMLCFHSNLRLSQNGEPLTRIKTTSALSIPKRHWQSRWMSEWQVAECLTDTIYSVPVFM